MIKLLGVIVTITSCLFFIGCNLFVDYDVECHDLMGRYVADSGDYPDIIEIFDDSTYSHTYHLYPQTPEVTTLNKWSCESENGETYIIFDNFIFGADFDMGENKKTKETPAFFKTGVHKYHGIIRICLPLDYYSYYVKEEIPKEFKGNSVEP